MKNKIKAFIDECNALNKDFEIIANKKTVEKVEDILFQLGYMWLSSDTNKKALCYFNVNGKDSLHFYFNKSNRMNKRFSVGSNYCFFKCLEVIDNKPSYEPKKIIREL